MSMSDKDTDKLFNQISKAMREGDSEKLDSLISTEALPEVPEEPEPSPTETPEPEVPEVPEEDNPTGYE